MLNYVGFYLTFINDFYHVYHQITNFAQRFANCNRDFIIPLGVHFKQKQVALLENSGATTSFSERATGTMTQHDTSFAPPRCVASPIHPIFVQQQQIHAFI